MIPAANITAWKATQAPWQDDALVEQDLILSKALAELYSNPILSEKLAFRGGTALHKIFIKQLKRYSEDIDLTQIHAEPIGPTADAIHETLNPWLGQPKYKRGEGRVTFIYRFETSIHPIKKMRLKIEINTREHNNVFKLIHKPFKVNNPWFTKNVNILTYELEELLGTKLRALYQRKKGRDLFDLHEAKQALDFNEDKLVQCFEHYTRKQNLPVSRAQFESNLSLKMQDSIFKKDMIPLLASNKTWNIQDAYHYVSNNLLNKLHGDAWKGK
ncbi:nucleotidyl transferase AbiEii/AbiGii toxin family protein [bacterium]|nr:nucleotidyl transferase AbiEii/AbiGii toxin family protein [bacterium]